MIVVDFGYHKVVLPKDKAFQLIECLESAERYEEKYWPEAKRKEKGMQMEYTYHVYPNETQFSFRVMSDEQYQLCKLAGKPQE
jgi:hypothetical protein